jgi:hypothetical protein
MNALLPPEMRIEATALLHFTKELREELDAFALMNPSAGTPEAAMMLYS